MSDYYEQAMTEIIFSVLQAEGIANTETVAQRVAAKLRASGFVQATGIGGPTERQAAAQ